MGRRGSIFSREGVAEYLMDRANKTLAIDSRYEARIKNDICLRLYIHNTVVECLFFGNHGKIVDIIPHSSKYLVFQ